MGGYISIWTLPLKIWVPVCTSSKTGGISEHFIWQVDLVGHFIWKLDLILLSVTYLGTSSENLTKFCHLYTSSYFGRYIWQLIWVLHLTSWPSCALHLKTWPNSAICFEWTLIDDKNQWRLHLWSLAVLFGGYIWELIWVLHLKIWTHLPFYALLHRRSFHITYQRPNKDCIL